MRLSEIEHWYSVKDAADHLGISRAAVHKRLENGMMGRAVRTRIGWLIEPESVQRVARERRNKKSR